MQFATRAKRSLMFAWLLGVAVDVLIGTVAAWLIPGPPLLVFGLAIAALIAIPFVLLLVHSALRWLVFLATHRATVAEMAKRFATAGYPEPRDYEDSVEAYLERVAADESLDPSARILAAADLGTFNAYQALGHAQDLVMLSMVAEEGLAAFKTSYRASSSAAAPQFGGV